MELAIAEKLVKERRARLAAERLLDQKSRELMAANDRLSDHARALSDKVLDQRQDLRVAQSHAAALEGRNHQIESDLERAQTAATLAQRRLWEALETIQDGFAVFDADQKLIIANGAYVALFQDHCELKAGQTYDQIIRMMATSGVVDLTGQDADDWYHEMIARLTQTEIAPHIVRLLDGRSLRLMDRRGDAGDLVCLTADITESVRREAELEVARISAEAASRAKSAFLANMSHEIRTPMNGVVGMADLLCETTLSEEQRLFAETIKSSGEALLTIINDVLDFSKAEAEKLRLYPEPFDLERCLHEVMLLLQPRAQEKGVNLVLDFDQFLPTQFVADPGRMRQILTNLLGNAVKFTTVGHVLARVVGLERGDGRFDLHFSIEDTGIGIAPEHLSHIFGEFNQIEDQSNRKFEGTGLGLAITRQLVGLMGGEIWVDSEQGKGSCFGFKVTVDPAEEVSTDRLVHPVTLKTALIADAAMVSRTILARQLETYGVEVTDLRTNAEVLDVLAGGVRPDLAILDQDGAADIADLIAEARRHCPGLSILVSCARTRLPHLPDGLMCGVLQKPILRSDLFRHLQDLSEPQAIVPLPAPRRATSSGSGQRHMRILAAEDNRTNQLVFSKMVQGLAIELSFASNGREAVDLWQHQRPDMIFMDISMPEMDGRQATIAIRAQEAAEGRGAHVPIVAMTAHAMGGDSDSILAAGLDRYLTKPLKKKDLTAEIARYCPAGFVPDRPMATGAPAVSPPGE